MKLMHPLFSSPICFTENRIQVLTIENPRMFRELVFELRAQAEGKDGRFVLSLKDHPLDCGVSLHVISDYSQIKTIEKRIQTKLLAALLEVAREELAEDTMLFTQEVQRYLGRLAAFADYPVVYEQSENLQEVLKAMDFHVDFSDLESHEALYEHISLCNRVMKYPCFVLVHAKAFFSREELRSIYEMAQYRKWNLLLLESYQQEERLEQEDHRLFDADLCELVLEDTEKKL